MKLTVKVVTYLTLIVLVVTIPSFFLLYSHQKHVVHEQARVRAVTLYQMIVVTRQWVAENRDKVVPVPAVATKELSQYASEMTNFRFHITSDQLVNPANAPDDFERAAMKLLRAGEKEYDEVVNMPELGATYRYIAPLFINESCLKCHIYQGYKVGEFRGAISVSVPLADIERSIAQNNRMLYAVAFMILTTIIFAVSLLMHKLVLRHLGKLTTAAGEIMKGKYGVTTGIETDDEIAELSRAMDNMSTQIAHNEEMLKAKLKDAVSKYVHLVDDLKEMNEQLTSVNRFKTDILDSISHEVRTPLTKIISAADLLNDPRLLENVEQREKFAHNIKKNAHALKSMFNDIVTLSRLEHLQYQFHFIPVPVRAMIEDILDTYEQEIRDRNLSISLDVHPNQMMCVDGEGFNTALINVIQNAIKYTRTGGSISFSVTEGEDSKTLHIADTGIGIPQDEVEKIFSRFFRASNAKGEFPGTGLGLTIVYRIVTAHNGKLTVTSDTGKGTTVSITIPCSNTCS